MTYAGPPPVALSIAGSDPSGGAGVQADLKTFGALGAYGTCVVTALTAQNTMRLTGIHAVPDAFVAQQLDTLLEDVRVDAVKIGMLSTASLAELVGSYLSVPPLNAVPIVLDPVMVSTSGARLVDDDAMTAVRALFPLASVVTPNLPEAATLARRADRIGSAELAELAAALRDMGAPRVLLKGGHLVEDEQAVDVWLDDDGVQLFTAERVATTTTHGTGCTLSSALAALRPRHTTWRSTVAEAKRWLTEAIRRGDELHVGSGYGPVHHFHELTRWNAGP